MRAVTYEVQARGVHGNVYVYHVDVPFNTSEVDIACLAYAEHGTALRAGILSADEYLGPDYTVRKISR